MGGIAPSTLPSSEEERRIAAVLCGGHRIFTDSFAVAIRGHPAIRLAGPPVDSPDAAVEACARHQPDVVLMDLTFEPGTAGIDAIRRIRELAPTTAVLVLAGEGEEGLIVEAVGAGAAGFLSKTEGLAAAIEAARAAARGDAVPDRRQLRDLRTRTEALRTASRDARERLRRLSPRELEVLRLLSDGARSDLIARRLVISEATVRTHIRNILGKLGVRSRLEAVAFVLRTGAFEREPAGPSAHGGV